MKSFWCAEEPGSVVDFTSLYGYWDDRVIWLTWLMHAAEGQGDWLTMLDAIASIATTEALLGRYVEAEEFFKRGQRLYTYANPKVQVRLLINHAYLYIFMNNFEEASRLLGQARTIAQQLEEPLRTRVSINIDYDYAAVLNWRGDLTAAKAAFTDAMTRANNFGWQSLANYAQSYLADIAINQGNYDEAERLLEPGLTMAERNKEKRRTSTYKRSFAHLRQKQGRLDEALTWAKGARDGFERLGVEQEVQRMDKLIKDLRSEISSQKK